MYVIYNDLLFIRVILIQNCIQKWFGNVRRHQNQSVRLISHQQKYIFNTSVKQAARGQPQINEGYSETISSTLKKNCLVALDPQVWFIFFLII